MVPRSSQALAIPICHILGPRALHDSQRGRCWVHREPDGASLLCGPENNHLYEEAIVSVRISHLTNRLAMLCTVVSQRCWTTFAAVFLIEPVQPCNYEFEDGGERCIMTHASKQLQAEFVIIRTCDCIAWKNGDVRKCGKALFFALFHANPG